MSLLGEADLHALDARGAHVAGQPVEEAPLMVSDDGGRSFRERAAPAVPIDVDLDPDDPERMVITTAEGLYASADAGASWRRRDVLTVETHTAFSRDGSLYRVDAAGSVKVSEDGGASWRETGAVDGSPTTVTVDARGACTRRWTGGARALGRRRAIVRQDYADWRAEALTYLGRRS